jgi:hypothetical protein
VTTVNFPSSSTVDSNLYIYKATYTPSSDFIGSVNISVPSSGVFSYSWLDVTSYVILGSGGGYFTSVTRTTAVTGGDTELINVDTEFRFELNELNSAYEVNEGDSLTFIFDTVHLSNSHSLSYRVYKLNSDNSASDDFDSGVSGSLYFVNGSSTINVTLRNDISTEGTETFVFAVYDSEGNYLTHKNFNVIDTSLTPPDAPILTLESDTGIFSDDLVTSSGVVTLNGLDPDGFWEYRFSNADVWQLGSGSTLSLSDDGEKTVYVRQTDLAGNTSDVSTLSFILDTLSDAPILTLESDTGIFSDDP